MAKVREPYFKPKIKVPKTAPNSRPKIKKRKKSNSKSGAILAFPAKNWVFFQNTALVGVPVMEDGYTLKKGYDKYVNANGLVFKNEDLLKYAKTYRNAHVFLNHDDTIEKSMGIVVDYVIRKIKDKGGNHHILVETLMVVNKNQSPYPDLVNRIVKDGEFRTSMSCMSFGTRCTFCGHISVMGDESDSCMCQLLHLGEKYVTEYGYESTISTLAYSGDGDVTYDPSELNEEDYDSYPLFFYENSILDGEAPAYGGVFNSYMIQIDPVLDNYVLFEISSTPLKRSHYNAAEFWSKKGELEIRNFEKE